MTFNNGGFIPGSRQHGTHWIVGIGTHREIIDHVLSDALNEVKGKPKLMASLSLQGARVSEYQMPIYPAGGPYGDHTVAIAHYGRTWAFGSVHGYDHADASAALAVAMALSAVGRISG